MIYASDYSVPTLENKEKQGWADKLAVVKHPVSFIAEPKWIRVQEQPFFRKKYHTVCCSECHSKGNERWKYCPNCGAKMTNIEGN